MSETNGICDVEAIKKFNYPKWTGWDFVRWHVLGSDAHLNDYKDGYILFHRNRIRWVAARYKIPVFLLAGVAWGEAGGEPDEWKYKVSDTRAQVRRSGWEGYVPDSDLTGWAKEPAEKTSFGIIAMQIRVAAGILNTNTYYPFPLPLPFSTVPFSTDFLPPFPPPLSPFFHPSHPPHPLYAPPLCPFCPPHTPSSMEMQTTISNCLMMDIFNIEIVARHLRDLILYDYPHADTLNLTDEQVILAASRYNRGIERKKEDFIKSIAAPPVFREEDDPEGYKLRSYTSSGRALMRHKVHVQELLP